MKKIKKIVLILSCLLLTIGLSLIYYFQPDINIENLRIKVEKNQELIGKIYLPKNINEPYPTIILAHGINSSKETMSFLGIELARNGVASVVFDFGNYGESYKRKGVTDIDIINQKEISEVFNYINQLPEKFKLDLIAMGGHSMGGIVALDFAKYNSKIKSTIVLGIRGEASPSSPHNLLFVMGLYDELNPPWLVRDSFKLAIRESNNNLIQNDQIYGNFAENNARKLFFSATADHFIAPYNATLVKESVNWILQSFNLQKNLLPTTYDKYIIGYFLIIISIIIICFYLLKYLPQNYQKKLYINLFFICINIFIFILSFAYLISFNLASNLLILTLCLQSLIQYYIYEENTFYRKVKTIIIFSFLLGFSFLIPTLLNGISEIINHPYFILELPIFIIQWFIFITYNIIIHIKNELFIYHTFTLIPSFYYILSLLFLLIFPEKLIIKIEYFLNYLITKIRQPLIITGLGKFSRRNLALLIILTILLIIIIYHQISIGLVGEALDRGIDGLIIFLKMLFIPLFLFLIFIKNWEF